MREKCDLKAKVARSGLARRLRSMENTSAVCTSRPVTNSQLKSKHVFKLFTTKSQTFPFSPQNLTNEKSFDLINKILSQLSNNCLK